MLWAGSRRSDSRPWRRRLTNCSAACAIASISSLWRWHEPGAAYVFIGGALFLIGTLLVTIVFNVPKNEALASVAPADLDAARRGAGHVAPRAGRDQRGAAAR